MRKGIERSTNGEEESEGVLIWGAVFHAHLGVEGKALVRLILRRVGLNELVVKKDIWP